ncbi:glycosyltransferase family 4 protein [Patescibacteria group bacterium]
MIIAIDGLEANTQKKVGIGVYAFQIISHIYKFLIQNSEFRIQNKLLFRIYLPNKPIGDMPHETDWWQYRVINPRRLWTFIALPLALKSDIPKADIIFSPTHYIPRFTKIMKVASIMDTSYLKYPQMFKVRDLQQLKRGTRYSVSHTDCIFTISNASKNDIINAYQKDSQQIVVTYPGITMKKANKNISKTKILEKYKISKNYIFSVGTLQPRKNYIRLIVAFGIFLKENRQKFSNVQLVIAGKKGWLYEDILREPGKRGLAKSVKFLDYVDDADLPILYQNALCFALPSLYEGFGLPVAEAMSFGCPVVVSNVSSLPEVAGNAAVYVNPESAKDIAKGLLASVRQRNLMQGKLRVKKGKDHIKQFTWENAAADTLENLVKLAEK